MEDVQSRTHFSPLPEFALNVYTWFGLKVRGFTLIRAEGTGIYLVELNCVLFLAFPSLAKWSALINWVQFGVSLDRGAARHQDQRVTADSSIRAFLKSRLVLPGLNFLINLPNSQDVIIVLYCHSALFHNAFSLCRCGSFSLTPPQLWKTTRTITRRPGCA